MYKDNKRVVGKGLTYCRPENKGKGRLRRTSKKRCSECGYKIRSIGGHCEGEHHLSKVEVGNDY